MTPSSPSSSPSPLQTNGHIEALQPTLAGLYADVIKAAEHVHGSGPVQSALQALCQHGRLDATDIRHADRDERAEAIRKGPPTEGGVAEGGIVGFFRRLTRSPREASEIILRCKHLHQAAAKRYGGGEEGLAALRLREGEERREMADSKEMQLKEAGICIMEECGDMAGVSMPVMIVMTVMTVMVVITAQRICMYMYMYVYIVYIYFCILISVYLYIYIYTHT